MVVLLGILAFGLFVFGLVQWAVGGDGIWRIFMLRRRIRRQGGALDGRERDKAEAEVRRLERFTDRALQVSLRVVAFVAASVWVAVGVTFLLDAFGVDWARHITTRASYYWRANISGFGEHNSHEGLRDDLLRSLGSGLK